jgi:Domain of unknown function (DUF4190)
MPSESQAAPWESPTCAISDDGYWWWSPERDWQRLPYVNSAGKAWSGFAWLPEQRPKDEWWQGAEPPKPTYRPLLAAPASADASASANPSRGGMSATDPGAQAVSPAPMVQPLQADSPPRPPMPPLPSQQWGHDEVGHYRTSLGLSPDGHYWWNGTAWQMHGVRIPSGAIRSANGQEWWDGQSWRPAVWQGGGPGFGSVLPRPTNGLAITSLVLGILWIWWIGSVLAVIFGHIALSQIRRRGEGGHGLAIAGLVLGYIGVGVLLLVIVVAAIGASVPQGG